MANFRGTEFVGWPPTYGGLFGAAAGIGAGATGFAGQVPPHNPMDMYSNYSSGFSFAMGGWGGLPPPQPPFGYYYDYPLLPIFQLFPSPPMFAAEFIPPPLPLGPYPPHWNCNLFTLVTQPTGHSQCVINGYGTMQSVPPPGREHSVTVPSQPSLGQDREATPPLLALLPCDCEAAPSPSPNKKTAHATATTTNSRSKVQKPLPVTTITGTGNRSVKQSTGVASAGRSGATSSSSPSGIKASVLAPSMNRINCAACGLQMRNKLKFRSCNACAIFYHVDCVKTINCGKKAPKGKFKWVCVAAGCSATNEDIINVEVLIRNHSRQKKYGDTSRKYPETNRKRRKGRKTGKKMKLNSLELDSPRTLKPRSNASHRKTELSEKRGKSQTKQDITKTRHNSGGKIRSSKPIKDKVHQTSSKISRALNAGSSTASTSTLNLNNPTPSPMMNPQIRPAATAARMTALPSGAQTREGFVQPPDPSWSTHPLETTDRLTKTPLAKWTKDDVLLFFKRNRLPIEAEKMYTEGIDGTALMSFSSGPELSRMGFNFGPALKVRSIVISLMEQRV